MCILDYGGEEDRQLWPFVRLIRDGDTLLLGVVVMMMMGSWLDLG